jgi:hypothetical protein
MKLRKPKAKEINMIILPMLSLIWFFIFLTIGIVLDDLMFTSIATIFGAIFVIINSIQLERCEPIIKIFED